MTNVGVSGSLQKVSRLLFGEKKFCGVALCLEYLVSC
jgi:hypothetical protein